MNVWAVLLAAGKSTRLAGQGPGLPKQFLPYKGYPLFWHSAMTFARLPALKGVVFVFPPEMPGGFDDRGAFFDAGTELDAYTNLIARLEAGKALGLPWRIALGGARRQDSVARGLALLPPDCGAVLVHDSARPFASPSLMNRVTDSLRSGHAAVIPAVPVSDTIKEVDDAGLVRHTLEREKLRAVQTPQGFALAPLREAHARAAQEGWEVTDDASLLERCGHQVLVVGGEESNRKITSPADLELLRPPAARTFFPMEADMPESAMLPCSGLGYDVHRYGGDRPYILGGVPIRCDVLIAAHSDGDTLLHALMDAMLGCIGGGDIGGMFPDTDPAFDNISSGILLSEVLERCRLAGLVITNVDITVIAQTPRIAPHREAIAANVAKLLQVQPGTVNVKATTEERLGFTGEKKGVKVMALVSGLKPASGGRSL